MSYSTQSTCDSVLYQLKCYRDHVRVRRDALELCGSYPTLRPQPATPPQGGPPILLLTGTLPILHQGSRYNIPVQIWVPDLYPYRPPIAYVVPTPEMSIARGHQHVDPSGMVYLPFLSTWNPSSHNLLGLAQTMCQIFGIQPPLYATPRSTPQPSPSFGGYSSGSSYPGATMNQQNSPYPSNSNSNSYNNNNNSPPPSSQYQTNLQQQSSYGGSPYPGIAMQSSQPAPWESHRPPPPPPEDPEVVLKRKKREELISKIRSKLSQALNPESNGVSELLRQYNEHAAEIKKQATLRISLEREAVNIDAEITQAKKKLEEAEKWLELHDRSKNPFDIDEASDPQDVWRKQLVKVIALDSSLEDIIYNIDKALAKGSIPLDEYLKLSRNISSEQFLARALIKKVREAIQSSRN